MDIQKAIELDKEVVASLRQGKKIDHADAVQLGIEALIHHQETRKLYVGNHYPLLPGESAGTDTPLTLVP